MSSIYAPNIITSSTVSTIPATRIVFSDGSKIQSNSSLQWNASLNRLETPVIAAGSGGDVALVLNPIGTGALQLRVADNTAVGGNSRGVNAIDLQAVRVTASQVASGTYAVAIGASNVSSGRGSVALGEGNTASGTASFAVGNSTNASGTGSTAVGSNVIVSGSYSIGGGYLCTSSGNFSFVLGQNAVASGTYSLAFGNGNTSSNTYAVSMGALCTATGVSGIAVGLSCSASNTCATAVGNVCIASGFASIALGNNGNTKGVEALLALGSFCATGFAPQTMILTLGGITTDGSAVRLTSNNIVNGNDANQLITRLNSAITFRGIITATTTGGGDCSSWEFVGQIQRGASGLASLVAPVTPVLITQKAGASSWAVSISASNLVNTSHLAVTVMGEVGKTIRWSCSLFATEAYF